MAVINQNSISGINSITAQSGSVQIFNSDGSTGSLTNLAGVNVSGVVTTTSLKVGTAVTVTTDGVQVGAGKSFRLYGSTSGFTDLIAPSAAGNNALTLPTGNGSSGQVLSTNGSGALSWIGAGKILQATSTTKTDTFSTTSSTLVDITGLSVSITPSSSSSKILIIAYINGVIDASSGSYGGRLQLVRGSTNIAQGDAAGSRQVGTGHLGGEDNWPFYQCTTITFLDSPSTTSSTTYKMQCAHTQSRTIRINAGANDTDSATYALRTVSSITAMEVTP